MRFLRYLDLLSRETAPEPSKPADDDGDGARAADDDAAAATTDAAPVPGADEPADPRRAPEPDRR